MIAELRRTFNEQFNAQRYSRLLKRVEQECGTKSAFRIAETPVFLERAALDQLANLGAALARELLDNPQFLAEARHAIPAGYDVAGQTAHPHFLTADFALVAEAGGFAPRLVELQAFPSVFGFQDLLSSAYRDGYELPGNLDFYLGGLNEHSFWAKLAETVVGSHDPAHVVLAEVDPMHQKTLPDFLVTARRLGIAIVDIASLEGQGDRLYRRDAAGKRVLVERMYNRAIADELIARGIRLKIDLTQPWQVEWAGHPNWYFLISKLAVPRLWRSDVGRGVVPPAVLLSDFLAGPGRAALEDAGVPLQKAAPDAVYSELLLKPLFSFAGKGIQFAPSQAELEGIAPESRGSYLLQQRMDFARTIDTPEGPTQAEFRVLYLWPDGGALTPAISLVRLGRGKMMGVDHNKDKTWVGASAALYPQSTGGRGLSSGSGS